MVLANSKLLLQHSCFIRNEDTTLKLGELIADILIQYPEILNCGGCTIWLAGDIGVGKTTLSRSLIHALGYNGHVRSPTYTLLESYSINTQVLVYEKQNNIIDIFHFDLYLFTKPSEWLNLGFNEYLSYNALRLIEWPQNAKDYLLYPDLELYIFILSENKRLLYINAYSKKGCTLFQNIVKSKYILCLKK